MVGFVPALSMSCLLKCNQGVDARHKGIVLGPAKADRVPGIKSFMAAFWSQPFQGRSVFT